MYSTLPFTLAALSSRGIDWPTYRSQDERVVELGDSVRVIPLPNSSKIDFLAAHPPREPVMGEGARPRNRD